MAKKALTIYKASAGSGKTFMLTRHYLTLALETEKKYTQILAITFTRKATAEMRQRIVEELKNLATQNKKSTIGEYIKQELEIDDKTLQERAKKLLTNILHDYSNFSITTIDQFFQRIIRSLTRELGLPAGYKIEMDEKKVLAKAIDILLDNSTSDKKLFDLFYEYIKNAVIEENKSHIFHTSIVNFIEKMLREDIKNTFIKSGNDNFENIISHYKNKLSTTTKTFENELKQRTQNFETQLNKHNLAINDLKNGTRTKYLYKTVTNSYKNTTTQLAKLFDTNIDEQSDTFLKKEYLKQLAHNYDNLYNIFCTDLKYFQHNYPQYYFAKHANRHLWHIAFFSRIWQTMNEIKQNENIFVIGDSSVLLSQLTDKNDTSFIFEKIASKYTHILIDEFQDTSTLQWENLRPFIINSMAQFNPTQQKSNVNNLIVGDVKQAIYRFRNGNWSLLQNEIDHQLGHLGIENIPLTNNWRSSKTIIDFNNKIFDILQKKIGFDYFSYMPAYFKNRLTDLYCDYKQEYPREEQTTGFVQIKAINNNDYRQQTIDNVVEQLLDMLDNGVKQGDIAILVRKTEHGQLIADKLLSAAVKTKHNIQIAMSDVLSVDKSIAINAIINTLKYIANPDEQYYIIIAAWLVNQTLNTNHEQFFEQPLETVLQNKLLDRLQHIKRMTIFDAVVEIINTLGLNNNRDEIPFISRFLNYITQYTENYSADQSEFLQHWESEKPDVKIPSPNTDNAIKIMTIHKSKGLEFKHVIIPFVDWKIINSHDNLLWVETSTENHQFPIPLPFTKESEFSTYRHEIYDHYFNNIIDSLNIIYVAFTRPKTSLTIITQQKPEINTAGQWLITALEQTDINKDNKIDTETNSSITEYSFGDKEKLYETDSPPQNTEIIFDSLKIKPIGKTEVSIKIEPTNNQNESELSQTEYGTVMHRIMEQITTTDTLDLAVKRVAAKGLLTHEKISEITNILKRAISNPKVQDWFAKTSKIYNEQVIIAANGKTLRPDRIVETKGGKRILIDYKFTSSQDEEHITQVANYAKILGKTDKKIDSAYLWYLLQNNIVKVL